MTVPAPSIVVTRQNYLISRTSSRPFCWLYSTSGPDGTYFENKSIVELRAVLKRHYPDAQIIEPWKAAAR